MFRKKKHSWFWFALWSLLFSALIFGVSRFFMHAVDTEARKNGTEEKPKDPKPNPDALFI
jgi:hypothetical protein